MLLLAVVHVLLGSGCRVVEPDWATVDRYYTAIAKVPKFFTNQRCGDDRAVPVDVYAGTSASKKIGQIRWAKAGNSPNDFYCVPLFFKLDDACPRGEVPLLEDGYEEAAFVMVARSGHWARIRLDRGSGWIRLAKEDEVVLYGDLVTNRMAELTPAWNARIYSKPGGRSRSFAHTKSRSVTVVGWRRFGGELWFRIVLLSNDQCSGREPHEIASGWVRAYSAKRQPVVMHFSRGC
jgi:hypothetical protein